MLEFFETSGHNLLQAEAAAGVRHHVALSIVPLSEARLGRIGFDDWLRRSPARAA